MKIKLLKIRQALRFGGVPHTKEWEKGFAKSNSQSDGASCASRSCTTNLNLSRTQGINRYALKGSACTWDIFDIMSRQQAMNCRE